VELPFPFPDFLPDENDRIWMVLDELVVADLEAGEDRTVRRLRRRRPRRRTLVGDDRVDDVAGPVVVADAGGDPDGDDHVLGMGVLGPPGPRGSVTGGHVEIYLRTKKLTRFSI